MCGRDAQWQIGFKLWALATPKAQRSDTNCLKMLSGVTVCNECRDNVKVQDFFLPEGKARIAQALSSFGKADPDFNAAVLAFEPVIDKPIDIDQMMRQVKAAGGTVHER